MVFGGISNLPVAFCERPSFATAKVSCKWTGPDVRAHLCYGPTPLDSARILAEFASAFAAIRQGRPISPVEPHLWDLPHKRRAVNETSQKGAAPGTFTPEVPVAALE